MTAGSALHDLATLEAGEACAEISLLGAELRRWSIGGLDLLWRPDPAVWPRVSPILFPIVGWARGGHIRVDGRLYPMAVHGFAADSLFVVDDLARERVRLRLTDSDATRACYPFAFELTVEYALSADGIAIELAVANRGCTAMPYACGVHPGFSWPLGRSERASHRVTFDRDEEGVIPEITSGGLFSSRRRAVPLEGRTLALDDALFAREALCWLYTKSNGVAFDNGSGATLRLAAHNFRHWALWTRPPAPYLCIEAWTGHGDPEGFDGELAEKPSMILLAPGERRAHRLHMSLTLSGSAGR